MKNKEKFIEELDEIFYHNGTTFGINEDGIPVSCNGLSCSKCILSSVKDSDSYKGCPEMRIDWMNMEYVPPKFSLPKDTTLEELTEYYIKNICGTTSCVECEFESYKYCRIVGFIKWMKENGLIELKEDIIISRDER